MISFNFNDFSNKTKIKLIFSSFVLLNIFIFSIIYTFFLSTKPYDITSSKSQTKILEREVFIKHYFEHSSSLLTSIKLSSSFSKYLEGDMTQKNNIINNMLLLMNSEKSIMQFRYLNKDGLEKVRVDRTDNKSIKVINDNKLQDKSNRDYFKQAKTKNTQNVFFSNIDLNIENRKIEIPYKPIVRGILPIINNKKFQGTLIVNFSIEYLISEFFNSDIFNMILIDNEGYTLSHYQKDKSWGRYKKNKINIKDIFPSNYNDILNNDTFIDTKLTSNKLDLPMLNKPILILQVKDKWIIELKQKYYNQLVIFFVTMLILSFLIAFIIYKIVNRLNLDLLERHNYEKTLNEYVDIIDTNVITSKTDLKGNITYTSDAFCKICGYTKSELIGSQHNIIRHKDMSSELYKEMWSTIKDNKTWEGEIKNKHKNGSFYWVYTYITPIYNQEKEKIGYMSVRHDITHKKELEHISITDALSGIHNKRFFYMVTPKFIQSKQRDNEVVCFVLMDIDNFKLYNDTYGHLKGDVVINSVATVLKEKMVRADDFCFRVGGEEFALLFKSNDISRSIKYVESIKQAIEDMNIEHKKNTASKYITVSMGMICKNALEINSIDKLYEEADNLLYEAKGDGRNILKVLSSNI